MIRAAEIILDNPPPPPIYSEKPLFTLKCIRELVQAGGQLPFLRAATALAEAAADAAVNGISIASRKAFLSLHQACEVHGHERTALRIFKSNALPLGSSEAQEAGVFLLGARSVSLYCCG
jgi:hypothetical protein